MKNLRSLLALLLVPLLLPVQLGTALLRVHVSRAKRARAIGDRGALSIEMALIVVVVVAIAGAVVTLVMNLGQSAKDKIPTTLPTITVT
ncbi:hypothetical protein [Kitasatospora viridis]|uniref:Uncharacterized protein n=1 Tax=Kitasatospora viridis TaxID=281105 RepID=A0A561UAS4_9ACTN|nr:hypothetical protein [Kitasatospora viridis]TWF96461.1 hypothetical protein FHX73_11233 [Kitasatospora viridis]